MTVKTLVIAAVLSAGMAGVAIADAFVTVKSKSQFLSIVNERSLQIPIWGVDLRVSSDGRISGKGGGRAVTGQWRWADGYFCRDLYWGKRDLGPNCQEVAVSQRGMVRFTSDRGTGRSADFRLR